MPLGAGPELRVLEAQLQEGQHVGELSRLVGHGANEIADLGHDVQRRGVGLAPLLEVGGHAGDAVLGDGQQELALALEAEEQRGRSQPDLAGDVFEAQPSRAEAGEQAGGGVEDLGVRGSLGPGRHERYFTINERSFILYLFHRSRLPSPDGPPAGVQLIMPVQSLRFAIAVLRCSSPSPAAAAPPAGGPVRRGRPPPMPVETLTWSSVPSSRRASSSPPALAAVVHHPAAGRGFLTCIAVRSGDRVQRGAVLFEIDSAPQQAGVAALESTRAVRAAELEFARQELARMKTLYAAGAVSQRELSQAETAEQTAEAALNAVDEQVRQQRTELAYYASRRRRPAPSATSRSASAIASRAPPC